MMSMASNMLTRGRDRLQGRTLHDAHEAWPGYMHHCGCAHLVTMRILWPCASLAFAPNKQLAVEGCKMLPTHHFGLESLHLVETLALIIRYTCSNKDNIIIFCRMYSTVVWNINYKFHPQFVIWNPRFNGCGCPQGGYEFGYDTRGTAGGAKHFRHEKREDDGSVSGHYGFIDANGDLHVIGYLTDAQGKR